MKLGAADLAGKAGQGDRQVIGEGDADEHEAEVVAAVGGQLVVDALADQPGEKKVHDGGEKYAAEGEDELQAIACGHEKVAF